jgi:hypothetical protein
MKALLKLFIIVVAGTFVATTSAFPEFPFCPAGGPPGWFNYFNDKHDKNIWRRYSQYNPYIQNAGRYPGYPVPAYGPAYLQNNYLQPPYSYPRN